MREGWEAVVTAGLLGAPLPVAHLAALTAYMEPPEPPPHQFEVRKSGAINAYFVNGRRMFHRDLLERKYRHSDPDNSIVWLRRYRRLVDERIQGADPLAVDRIRQIWLRLEEAYTDPRFPAKMLYEAFCLGRVVAILEESNAQCCGQVGQPEEAHRTEDLEGPRNGVLELDGRAGPEGVPANSVR